MKPLLEGLLSPFEPEAFDAEAAEHLLTRCLLYTSDAADE